MSLKQKSKDELIQLIYKYRAAESLRNAPTIFIPEKTFFGKIKGIIRDCIKDIIKNVKKRWN